jgi:hypothetical protein
MERDEVMLGNGESQKHQEAHDFVDSLVAIQRKRPECDVLAGEGERHRRKADADALVSQLVCVLILSHLCV